MPATEDTPGTHTQEPKKAPRVRKKKQMSEHRRLQNRQAQKNYRERQKQQLESLKGLLQNPCLPNASIDPSFTGLNVNSGGTGLSNVFALDGNVALEALDDLDFTSLQGLSSGQTSSLPLLPAGGFPGYSAEPSLMSNYDSPSSQIKCPSNQNLQLYSTLDNAESILLPSALLDEETKTKMLERHITTADIVKAGLKALLSEAPNNARPSHTDHPQPKPKRRWSKTQSRLDNSRPHCTPSVPPEPELDMYNNSNRFPPSDRIIFLANAQNSFPDYLPSVYKNNIRLKQFVFRSAMMANATMLGLSWAELLDEETESPFSRLLTGSSLTETETETYRTTFAHVKPDLRPSETQVKIVHHPWLDLFPSSTFRERAIKLITAEPPMIDEWDLCQDMENDGLVCWGSSLGSASSSTGSGAPWDLRSYEAQPWFLKKWWILVGGEEDKLYQQSRWWNELRGDSSGAPW